MKSNDIDNLFKRGIEESELRSEQQLFDAKSRVWDAIQKPIQNRQRWLLMSSIAAAVSMFVIASILYLKLDSKQKELEVLQAEIYTTVTPNPENIKSIEPQPGHTEELRVIPDPAPPTTHEKTKVATKPTTVQEEIIPSKAEPLIAVESPKLDLVAQLDPVIDLPQETGLEQLKVPEASTASAIDPTPRKRAKLRLKIGSGNASDHNSQNSLALNIKL
jgi:hypothetical protein